MSIVKVIKAALIIFALTIIGILVIFIINLKKVNNSATNNEYIVTNMLNMDDDFGKILRETAKKNGNWSNLPLSDNFKEKYTPIDGILKGDNYTNLYLMKSGMNKAEQIVVFNVSHNFKEEEYYVHYTVNDKNELDDVEIVDKILRYDENGKEVIYKVSMDKDNYEFNISRLAYPFGGDRDPRDYINMTNNYIGKYYNGFIQISVADRITALPITKISDYDSSIVYLEIEYCIYNGDEIGDWYGPMYYKIKYATDENLWLDDVEVEEVSKEEIDRLLSEVKNNEKLN